MLSGVRAIITGASSGIGEATAKLFTKEGAKVIGVGRNEAKLQTLKDEGSINNFIACDLTKEGACEKTVNDAKILLDGPITTLVNCAGVLIGGRIQDSTMEKYNSNFQGNVQSTFEMIQHSIPSLKEAAKLSGDSATIINVSSVTGQQSFGGCALYCASKAAVDMLTKCSSVDLAPDNIRVVLNI
jgi:NAD(P)-dependent dehydrogenase (short-subunit alcohol dehydrogenase family)